jgi:hypothetical protein
MIATAQNGNSEKNVMNMQEVNINTNSDKRIIISTATNTSGFTTPQAISNFVNSNIVAPNYVSNSKLTDSLKNLRNNSDTRADSLKVAINAKLNSSDFHDNQNLSILGQVLSISGGNSLNIPIADTTFKQLTNLNLKGGISSLRSISTGTNNIALGDSTLYYTSKQSGNVALGARALVNNGFGTSSTIFAKNNSAIGSQALYANTTGSYNTAIGWQALLNNTTANSNVAIGPSALSSSTTGGVNIAIGRSCLQSNTTGSYNTGIGYATLSTLTTGSNNIAIGNTALVSLTTGSNNIAIGNDSDAINGDNQLNINNWITAIEGKVAFPSTPIYTSDADADADIKLKSGGFYKLASTGRIVYQKP